MTNIGSEIQNIANETQSIATKTESIASKTDAVVSSATSVVESIDTTSNIILAKNIGEDIIVIKNEAVHDFKEMKSELEKIKEDIKNKKALEADIKTDIKNAATDIKTDIGSDAKLCEDTGKLILNNKVEIEKVASVAVEAIGVAATIAAL